MACCWARALAVRPRSSRGRGISGSPAPRGGRIAALGLLGLFGAAPADAGYALGVTALAACATGALILDILAGGSWATRWLESGMAGADRLGLVRRVFVAFPCVLPARPFLQRRRRRLGPRSSVVITFAIAGVSYLLVERPFLANKARLSATPEIESAPAALGLGPAATKNGRLALPASR